jgi:hypothetical protein
VANFQKFLLAAGFAATLGLSAHVAFSRPDTPQKMSDPHTPLNDLPTP